MGYDIRVKPSDASRMYVTEAFAGVFRSEDYGRTWLPSNDGITVRTGESGDSIPVFCLTLDPSRPETIWIGTQGIRGVYRSDDGGMHWAEKVQGIAEAEGITFRGFAVDPRDSDVVYGAAEISSWAWASEERRGREFDLVKGVVYKTTDGGEHWSPVWRGDNLARYVWIDPRNSDVVYVSTGIFDREAANSKPDLGVPGGIGVIKSTDAGHTWSPIHAGLNNLYVGSLFMHPTNPDVLLAGTGNVQYRNNAGVYLTKNGGASWKRTLVSGEPVTAVEFSASNPDIAYAGSRGLIWRSADGGLTWREMTKVPPWGPPGIAAGFPIDFQVDPTNPDRLFVNSYGGGNFLSTDAGKTWKDASQGYTGAQVRAVAVDPSHPGRAYVAARSGVFRTIDGGGRWAATGRSPANTTEFNAFAVDPVGGSHLLAGTNAGGNLLASYDGGVSWRVTAHLDERRGWRVLVFAPSNPTLVYAGTGGFFSAGVFANELSAAGVFTSADGGLTWRRPTGDFSDAHVAALAVDRVTSTRVFAATTNYGVLISEDGGRTWRSRASGLPEGKAAMSIAIDPSDPDVLIVGLEGAGAYRSSDGGASWRMASAGMDPEAAVSAVVFSLRQASLVFAADRRTGVYRSTDSGATWSQINEGLQCRAVGALALSNDGKHIYAGTEGSGAYRLDLDGSPPKEYQVPPPGSLSRPKPSKTAVSRSKSFTVAGTVRPGHATAGTLSCEKYSGGRWRKFSTYTRTWTSSLTGAYRVSYRLPRGKYRFRAAHGSRASTACHQPSTSALSVVIKVK